MRLFDSLMLVSEYLAPQWYHLRRREGYLMLLYRLVILVGKNTEMKNSIQEHREV